jgi:hypothetical protein
VLVIEAAFWPQQFILALNGRTGGRSTGLTAAADVDG